jgi:hypothetical protein
MENLKHFKERIVPSKKKVQETEQLNKLQN